MARIDELRRAVGAEEDAGAKTRKHTLGYAAALAAGAIASLIPVGGVLFLSDVPPLLTAGFSCLFAGLVLLPLAGRPRFTREDRPRLVGIAFFGAALAPVLFFSGLPKTTGSEAAVLVNAETVFTLTLAVIILRERTSALDIVAVAVVVTGAMVLSLAGGASFQLEHLIGNALIVLSTLCWACDNVISTGLARRNAPHLIAAWKNLVGAPAVVVIAVALGASLALTSTQWLGLLMVGGLGIGASLVLFYTALRHIGAYRTSAIFGLQGAFGSVLGYWLLGDRLALGQILGAVAMVGGVLILAWSHRTQTVATVDEKTPAPASPP